MRVFKNLLFIKDNGYNIPSALKAGSKPQAASQPRVQIGQVRAPSAWSLEGRYQDAVSLLDQELHMWAQNTLETREHVVESHSGFLKALW